MTDLPQLFARKLSATIAPFKLLTPWKAILPIDNGTLIPEQKISGYGAPGLVRWWDEASKIWETNRTKSSKLSLYERGNYYSLLNKQTGGTNLRVFYTASGTKLAAAISDDPQAIAEHALYWLPVRSMSEARYLTAVLNAPITTEIVQEYQSVGLFGGRHFDTYPWMLAIPQYDPFNGLHQHLVELSEECESIAGTVPEGSAGFQKIRGNVRKKLDEVGLQQQLDEAVADLLEHGEEAAEEE
ncbi:hypothetical protein ACG98H_13415 [Corynebacterium sp. L4756]